MGWVSLPWRAASTGILSSQATSSNDIGEGIRDSGSGVTTKCNKVEHNNLIKELTDEQLEAAINYIEAALAAKAGDQAKVIEGIAEPTALPAPELEPQRKRPNRLLEHADNAVGPKERGPRKRVPSPAST